MFVCLKNVNVGSHVNRFKKSCQSLITKLFLAHLPLQFLSYDLGTSLRVQTFEKKLSNKNNTICCQFRLEIASGWMRRKAIQS